ncbi:hypothetical protein D917_09528, partial [Trichinella nativa]
MKDKSDAYSERLLESEKTSYLIFAELIMQKRKSHAIAENLIMPVCKIITGKMLEHDGAQKMENIPLSSTFLLFKLMSQQISPTNVTQLVFVRFINKCHEIQEIFFCCKELPEMSKGKDVFNVLSLHLETKDLSWKNCVGICTDGALSMVGSTRGFVSLVKQENPDIVSTHYFLYREVLISKSLESKLKKVFDDVRKMINIIKQSLFTPKCSKSHV